MNNLLWRARVMTKGHHTTTRVIFSNECVRVGVIKVTLAFLLCDVVRHMCRFWHGICK